MKAKDSIHKLVHSLSQAEKRFFKQHTSRYRKTNGSHLQILFDHLVQQEEFDETAIKSALGSSSLSSHFAESKYQLNQVITRSLALFHQGKTAKSQILAFIEQAEALIGKGLAEQALGIIRKAKDLAFEYERFGLQIELLELERKAVLYFSGYNNSQVYLKQASLERKTIVRQFDVFTQLNDLGDELYLFYLQHGVVRKQEDLEHLNDIFNHDLLQDISNANSVRAKIWFIYCYRTRAFLIQDNDELHHWSLEYIDLLDSAPFTIKEHPTRYITAIGAYLDVCFDLKLLDDFHTWLQKLAQIPISYKQANNAMTKMWVFETHSRLLLYYFIYTGRFDEAVPYIDGFEAKLNEFTGRLANEGELLLHFAILIVHLGARNLDKALTKANLIIDDSTRFGREDILSMTHILRLIIHYELENFVLLPYLVRSVYRHLLKKERLFFAEKAIIRFLKKLSTLNDPADLPLELENLKHTLLEIEEDSVENIALQYFDIISWLESKIEGKDFAELIRLKANSKN